MILLVLLYLSVKSVYVMYFAHPNLMWHQPSKVHL